VVVKVSVTSGFGVSCCRSVRRCSSRSTSFVLAALRALQVDPLLRTAELAAIEETGKM